MIGKQKEDFINSKLSIYKNAKDNALQADKKRVKHYEDHEDSKDALRSAKKKKNKSPSKL